ncbi:MAG TPA: ATP-binding cassette domain-containing protein, partial [Thermodesulfobacteriota bacterium]|nr:ATP-binding cassette domain-containing protein [Thermodesulfobacteriota bacterium]
MSEVLKAERLRKNFGGLTAVSGVDFLVGEGQAVGVIGPNGSGKSTLFNLLSGHLPPTEGRVRFLGRDVTEELPHRRVMMGMARSFQLVSVFN